MKSKKYSDHIMQNVRQNLGLEADDTSRDEIIMSLPPIEVFNRFCTWEGLIGYGNILWDAAEEIRNFQK